MEKQLGLEELLNELTVQEERPDSSEQALAQSQSIQNQRKKPTQAEIINRIIGEVDSNRDVSNEECAFWYVYDLVQQTKRLSSPEGKKAANL